MEKTIKLPILCLIIIGAGVLAAFIYLQPDKNPVTSGSPYKTLISVHDQNTSLQNNRISPQDRSALFPFPGVDAPDQERKQHADLVMKLAQETDELFIDGCKPNPLVMNVSLKKDFTVKNSDSVGHQIFFQSVKLEIPANGSLVVHPSQVFNKGQGDYGYYCDGNNARGIFYVTP